MNAKTVPIDVINSMPDSSPLEETDCNMASMDMIIMSSITATPRIMIDASSLIIPSSSNMRITITGCY